MDLDLALKGTLTIITGAGGQIGEVLVVAFLREGCFVGATDIKFSQFRR